MLLSFVPSLTWLFNSQTTDILFLIYLCLAKHGSQLINKYLLEMYLNARYCVYCQYVFNFKESTIMVERIDFKQNNIFGNSEIPSTRMGWVMSGWFSSRWNVNRKK